MIQRVKCKKAKVSNKEIQEKEQTNKVNQNHRKEKVNHRIIKLKG